MKRKRHWRKSRVFVYSTLLPLLHRQPRVLHRPAPDAMAPSGPFEGRSEHRDQYREIKLPAGLQLTLGVQIVGGRFYRFLPRGVSPPAKLERCFPSSARAWWT